MSKVAIVTWTKWNNYGTVLQSYALCSILSASGFDAYVLDDRFISSSYCIERWGEPRPFRLFLNRLKARFNVKNDSAWERFASRRERFITKQKRSLIRYWRKDVRYATLGRLSHQFDYFVCGSDQIWTPDPVFFDPYYFLTFVNDKPKIAYAPSFGRSSFPDDKADLVRLALRDFAHLSVREETGKRIIESITGRNDVETVLDPTMLLTAHEWESRLHLDRSKCPDGPYALFYFLGDQSWYRLEATSFCKQKGIQEVCIPTLPQDYHEDDSPEIGAVEFLSLIRSATHVFTDSYHGFLFSLIFQRDVYVFQRFDETDSRSQNSRVKDLCRRLQLSHRYFAHAGGLHLSAPPIDYSLVDRLIAQERQKSFRFLMHSLDAATARHGTE